MSGRPGRQHITEHRNLVGVAKGVHTDSSYYGHLQHVALYFVVYICGWVLITTGR